MDNENHLQAISEFDPQADFIRKFKRASGVVLEFSGYCSVLSGFDLLITNPAEGIPVAICIAGAIVTGGHIERSNRR